MSTRTAAASTTPASITTAHDSRALPPSGSPREQFAATSTALLDGRDDLAVVYAEISGQHLEEAAARHPSRVINVGIREQLLVSVAGGLALGYVRPIVHTFSPFLIERAFEQIKLDLGHQGVGAVLVGSGGAFDMAAEGRTHQSTGDVALTSSIPGMRVHAPASAAEVDATIRAAAADVGLHYVRISEQVSHQGIPADGAVHLLRQGRSPLTLLALGPMRDAALQAGGRLDATVLATTQVHPLDGAALRELAGEQVVVIEPWLEGTSLGAVSAALGDRPRRFLGIGTQPVELRQYGTPPAHEAAHGLRAQDIERRVRLWLSDPAGSHGLFGAPPALRQRR